MKFSRLLITHCIQMVEHDSMIIIYFIEEGWWCHGGEVQRGTNTNKLISENSILKGEPHRSMKMSRWKRVVTETKYVIAIIQVRSGENNLRLWQRWQKEQSQIHEAWRQDEWGRREKAPGKHIPKVLNCMVGYIMKILIKVKSIHRCQKGWKRMLFAQYQS